MKDTKSNIFWGHNGNTHTHLYATYRTYNEIIFVYWNDYCLKRYKIQKREKSQKIFVINVLSKHDIATHSDFKNLFLCVSKKCIFVPNSARLFFFSFKSKEFKDNDHHKVRFLGNKKSKKNERMAWEEKFESHYSDNFISSLFNRAWNCSLALEIFLRGSQNWLKKSEIIINSHHPLEREV